MGYRMPQCVNGEGVRVRGCAYRTPQCVGGGGVDGVPYATMCECGGGGCGTVHHYRHYSDAPPTRGAA